MEFRYVLSLCDEYILNYVVDDILVDVVKL